MKEAAREYSRKEWEEKEEVDSVRGRRNGKCGIERRQEREVEKSGIGSMLWSRETEREVLS